MGFRVEPTINPDGQNAMQRCAAQVARLPMVYEVNIFLTNRHLPIPEVLPGERLLVEQKDACGFYHVIARSAADRLPCMWLMER